MALMFKGPAALTTGSTITTASATITGGSVDGVAIGGTTAAAGTFAALTATGLTTINSTGGLKFSVSGTPVTSINYSGGTTGSALVLATQKYVEDNAGGLVTPISIGNGTADVTLANGTTYTVTSGGGVINRPLLGAASLTDGGIVRFVVTDATNAITFTAGTGVSAFKIPGALTATTLTFDEAGQGLDFIYAGGALVKLQGGFATAT